MENRIKAITGYTKAEIKAKYNTTPLKFYQARKAMKAMEAYATGYPTRKRRIVV